MMVGLQGSGKTTTTGKLANYLKKEGRCARSWWRPTSTGPPPSISSRCSASSSSVPVFHRAGRCSRPSWRGCAYEKAAAEKLDTVIIDTAGRLADRRAR